MCRVRNAKLAILGCYKANGKVVGYLIKNIGKLGINVRAADINGGEDCKKWPDYTVLELKPNEEVIVSFSEYISQGLYLYVVPKLSNINREIQWYAGKWPNEVTLSIDESMLKKFMYIQWLEYKMYSKVG